MNRRCPELVKLLQYRDNCSELTQTLLANFKESNKLTIEDMRKAEEHLVHVWAGAKFKLETSAL